MAQMNIKFGPSERIYTPTCIARFPNITIPHSAFGKEVYDTCGIFDPQDPEWQAVISKLEALREAAREEFGKKHAVSWPIGEDLDRETHEPTGKLFIRAKLPAVTSRGVHQKPLVLDSQGNPVDPPPMIGPGSAIRLLLDVSTSFAGGRVNVSPRLSGVQIIELRAPREVTADAFGVRAVDGYVASASDAPADLGSDFEASDKGDF